MPPWINRRMKVLVACECSGRVRDAFLALGHEALSCDLKPSQAPGPHYQGDVRNLLGQGWDLMVAHPPCTYLSLAGTRHLRAPGRRSKLVEARAFVQLLWEAPIKRICLENPRPFRMAAMGEPTQVIQPYFFGDPFMKTTCLWLKGLPKLRATQMVAPTAHWVEAHRSAAIRAMSFPGVAAAMAAQWGDIESFGFFS